MFSLTSVELKKANFGDEFIVILKYLRMAYKLYLSKV